MSKLCVIYNTAPRYRESIFCALDNNYDCDWYFGHTKSDIKEMDVTLLKSVNYYKTVGDPARFYIKIGLLKLLFSKKYNTYLMLADIRSLTDWAFYFFAVTLFKRKKLYLWTHGWYGKERGVFARMKLWLFNKADGTFVYGNYARKLLIKEGVPADKLFTIHNSLHYDQQKALREELIDSTVFPEHFGNNYPVLFFVGRLTKVKMLDMLIEAVAILKNRGENYNIVFVGDGTEKDSLCSYAIEKGLSDQVWFYGQCYDERLNAELIYNADLCVSPGNVGLTAMHSMVFGTPVISHNEFKWQMPEFEAIIPNKTGDFYEYNNVCSLADTISAWFANNKDRRTEIRENCFKEIDKNWTPKFQMDVINKNLKF